MGDGGQQEGASTGEGGGRAGKDRAGGASTGGEGPGKGKLDGCIMQQVHTSSNNACSHGCYILHVICKNNLFAGC